MSQFSGNTKEFDICNCGNSCLVRTSRTPNNPGRRFFGCKIPKDKGGRGYFKWIDPSPEVELLKEKLKEVEEERDLLKHKMKDVGDKIDSLKQKLKVTKKERDCEKAKFKRLVIVVLCVLVAKILFGLV
ncbi:uncharacterized protein LOC132034729 [Lycium ferocissimum]|uniref:uncharacterized protein LOC132034729 n=1 Tax=Lycium ferocissimum TaxID=112874 RepID=UPI002815A637|nr:uncharacterized protein LOC132034729 [Lycium ferocissimum]